LLNKKLFQCYNQNTREQIHYLSSFKEECIRKKGEININEITIN